MLDDTNFTITNTTGKRLPVIPFLVIKNKILGKKYKLSLVFIEEKKSQELNKSYRNKNTPTNVLSFSINKDEGEIFMTPEKAKKETALFGRNFKDLITYLFIHSLLHLKGFEHGSTMDKAEEKLLNGFSVKS